jgi:EAL domain-containing protein (putative c-di-GMP-specific phosphodiesterase class I)
MVLDASPDFLKIDRFFVSHCDAEPRRRAIIQSIAELAQRFGAESIAEGVERPEELVALADQGIDLIQGYLFAKPLPLSFFLDRDAAGDARPVSGAPLALAWR